MKSIRKNSKYFSFIMALSILLLSCSKNEIASTNSVNSLAKRANETGEDAFKAIFFGTGDLGETITQFEERDELFKSLPIEKKLEFENNINLLIQEIKSSNPNYFNDFKATLKSGDFLNIKFAIEDASNLIMEKAEIIIPGITKLRKKVSADYNANPQIFKDNQSVKDYITNNFQDSEYDNLLNENIISNQRGFTFAFGLVFYFAVVVHNTIGLSAVAGVYLAVKLWGPSLQSSFSAGFRNGSGGSGGGPKGGGPQPIIPTNEDEANLMKEMLIDDIVSHYAN